MGGKEAMGELQRFDPAVKAIVSSGYASDLIMANFSKYGFKGVVPKPYQIFELGRAPHKALKSKWGRHGLVKALWRSKERNVVARKMCKAARKEM